MFGFGCDMRSESRTRRVSTGITGPEGELVYSELEDPDGEDDSDEEQIVATAGPAAYGLQSLQVPAGQRTQVLCPGDSGGPKAVDGKVFQINSGYWGDTGEDFFADVVALYPQLAAIANQWIQQGRGGGYGQQGVPYGPGGGGYQNPYGRQNPYNGYAYFNPPVFYGANSVPYPGANLSPPNGGWYRPVSDGSGDSCLGVATCSDCVNTAGADCYWDVNNGMCSSQGPGGNSLNQFISPGGSCP
jgi:hypothetical protein